jgi:hypothetical protein
MTDQMKLKRPRPGRDTNYFQVPTLTKPRNDYMLATGARGGIIMSCKDVRYQFSEVVIITYMISCLVTNNRNGNQCEDKMDQALFFASMVMTVGDGSNTPF